MSLRRIIARLGVAVAVPGLSLLVAASPAQAATTVRYHAAYVEPAGGPQQSPFSCPLGTTCGSASFSGLGHASNQVGEFNACGLGCHVRTVWFDDGSTLVLRTVDQPGPFAFTSPGSSGQHGYNAFGLPGNPQFLDIVETVVGGSGRFAGATGGGSGRVQVSGGVAVGHTSGSITLL
jgi:hypothetical protein